MTKRTFKVLIIPLLILLLSFVALTSGSIYFFTKYCAQSAPAKSEFGKSPVLDKGRVSEGFTLFSTLNGTDIPFKEGTVYLVDLYGRPVHSWKTKSKMHYSILKPDGNLMAAQLNPVDKNFPIAGRITVIQELDKNSNVVWEYQNNAMHHDFDILPSGNLAVLVWEKIPLEVAQKIKGGRTGSEFNKIDVLSDKILEIDRDKNIVWSWSAYQHLNTEEFAIPLPFSREQWTHTNSVKYVKSDPFFQKEAYLISLRNINTVFLISKETGNIIWQSPKGLLGHQHDATLLNNGNILVFNNGFFTYTSNDPLGYGSRVLEIDPHTNQISWEFSGGNNPLDRSRLTEVILSGAQRLPSGNTLITLGTSGRIIEVTPDKKVVWDMINPYSDPTNQPFPSNYIFKARRYFKEDVSILREFDNSSFNIQAYCF